MLKKRFIAGATCPKCGELDKIFTYLDEQQEQWRACASCDFTESFKKSSAAEELPTRVNQHRLGEPRLAHETPIEAVKIIK